MKIGLAGSGGLAVEALAADALVAEKEGFDSYSLANIFENDALIALTVAGLRTSRIELTTAVMPTFPRHPTVLAQQALTAQAVCAGRLTLGIGLSHKLIIDDMLGMSFEKPARHMREYLGVLMPLLNLQRSKFDGEQYRTRFELDVPGAVAVPCLLAAMGPVMLKLAGTHTDGTHLWMTGPKTIESHIAPRLRAAAAEAGRPEPRIYAGIAAVITSDVDGARARAARDFEIYGSLPSYRGMLDREGLKGPADFLIAGDEKAVEAGLRAYKEAGATDVALEQFGTPEEQTRTRAFAASLAPDC